MQYKDKLKEIHIKNCTCHYSGDIIKHTCSINILLDEKFYGIISVYDISYKTWTVQNHCVLGPIK